ncbi:MAG: metallopeptidase family protein [Maricaulaceae bacterium]|nr:metallopeptidase family protein [Maricaulaceae bacterium]
MTRHPLSHAPAPDIDAFQAIAERAWADLPAAFRQMCGRVEIRVQDFAEDEVLADLGIDNPFELSGLYHGVDLTQRSVADPSPEPDRVFLYRRPILDEWAERGDVSLYDLIAHVLVHEIGHHFGLSDEAMHEIEDRAAKEE